METNLKKTVLNDEHRALKARMVPFGGWDMPVQYSGVMAEHEAVRTRVGLFDVSHMGEFIVTGPQAKAFLNRVTTNDLSKLYDGRCQYGMLCYPNGTVVDDLIISQLAPERFLVVVNASNIQKDFDWMALNNREKVDLENISDLMGLIAIQGPKAALVVEEMFGKSFADLKYYHICEIEHEGHSLFVSRTGYTGEDGFEVMMPTSQAVALWRRALEVGAKHGIAPVGLGARDTLRLEAAYSLYGHEINDTILPLEAGLGWVVALGKGDFVGRDALVKGKEAGLKRHLRGFEMTEAGIAREGSAVFSGGKRIGHVTSGTHSPTLKKALGLVLVDAHHAAIGSEIEIDIRGKMKKARLIKTPFYKRPA